MTGPITLAEKPDRSEDRLLTLLRRAINDPGAFVRRERWSDQLGVISGWVYESLGTWSARAVAEALQRGIQTWPEYYSLIDPGMVERAARAEFECDMAGESSPDAVTWDQALGFVKQAYVDRARAGLAAALGLEAADA